MDLVDQTQWERECKEGRTVTPLSMNCRKGSYNGDPHLYAKPKLKRRKLVQFGS